MPELHPVLIIATAALVTVLLRFLPFLIFGENRKTPPLIEKLAVILPYAIMAGTMEKRKDTAEGMLVVYCLKDIKLTSAPFGIPEAIACAVVALLHVWKRNTLLSIGAGTLCYMLLVQFVF